MIKRSNAIKLALLGTGSLAVYAIANSEECRPHTPGTVVTPGWHLDGRDPLRECRSRSWRRSGSSGGHWGWTGSSSSSDRSAGSSTTVSHQTTTSRGGFGGSGLVHSSGS